MISNSSYAPVIHAHIEELSAQGLEGLSELICRLFNELMKAEREHASQAAPYERTEARKDMVTDLKIKMT